MGSEKLKMMNSGPDCLIVPRRTSPASPGADTGADTGEYTGADAGEDVFIPVTPLPPTQGTPRYSNSLRYFWGIFFSFFVEKLYRERNPLSSFIVPPWLINKLLSIKKSHTFQKHSKNIFPESAH